jgi:putative CocE/NonD family hydrolase
MGPFLVKPKQTLTMPLPGATEGAGSPLHLDSDVYYPDGAGPFPVLLMRQPYGRAIASTVVYAHPRWYASHGYIVVIQDVRGRGTSGGEFELFSHELADGYATVLWAAQLPQSNGYVGMYGFSYQGMTQLYAAASRPAPLKTIAPAMVGYDLYADWAYENGALLLQAGLGWALQLAAETARRAGDRDRYHALHRAAHHLPLDGPNPANPNLLADLAPDSFFHDWLANPKPDCDYWPALTPDLTALDLPMLHIGGWFDPYLRGDLRLYHQMVSQSQSPQHLWIGPWGHIPWGRRVGAMDFGTAANSPIDALQIRWFDRFLKGQANGLEQTAAVQLFAMGSNQWHGFDHWPLVADTALYLASTGLAGMDQQDGTLQSSISPSERGEDTIVHDPWRPVPALGGHSGVPSGPFDRAAIDSRSDVLTYTSGPLTESLSVVGTIQLALYCWADSPSFDISAVVSVVGEDGRVINLTQGYCRVEPPAASFLVPEDSSSPGSQVSNSAKALESGDHGTAKFPVRQVALPLQPTCFCLKSGQALRLSLASSCFPAYAVNSGTGQSPANSDWVDHQIITLTVYHSREYPSRLGLPCPVEGRTG